MLRHTALFLWKDTTGEEQKLGALKGLAYLSYGCPTVRAVDFGIDIDGGSSPLITSKPWERTPLWNAREVGPPSNYDMALNLDFDDQDGLDGYNSDDVHHEVAVYNASVCRGEFTARVDWYYEGSPRIERFGYRHTELFLWLDEVDESQRSDFREALESLSMVPGVTSVEVGNNVGTLATDYDMILDVMLENGEAATEFLSHRALNDVNQMAALVTKYEWTARITHEMAAG